MVDSRFIRELHVEKSMEKGQYLHSLFKRLSQLGKFENSAADKPREEPSPQKLTQLLATCGALSSLMCLHKSCPINQLGLNIMKGMKQTELQAGEGLCNFTAFFFFLL